VNPSRPFVLLLLLSIALLLYVAFPFRTPLFLAAVLTAVLNTPVTRLTRALNGRRVLASALATLGVFLVIVAPLASLVTFATRESLTGFAYVRDELGVHSVEQLRALSLPEPIERLLSFFHLTEDQLFEGARRLAELAQGAAPSVLATGGQAVLSTVIMLIALYFLLVEGKRVADWIVRVSPLTEQQTIELNAELRKVTRATVIGILTTAVFQGVAAGVGYFFASIPHAGFFGMLTALVSFVPGVGTALVWVPAAASLWLAGRRIAAVLLVAFCLIVVVGAEQVGKPLLMQGQFHMHTGLIFLSLLGGLAMFGLLGIILGPLIVAFFLAMMRIYERDFRRGKAPG
jgi:predicted PurR-regulated permease PerM